MDMSQYRDLFLAEAREHLQSLNETVLALEGDPSESENINTLFRSAHSLKGMAASMGYDRIAGLAHSMEELMSHVRDGVFRFSGSMASLLLESADLMAVLINDVENDRPHTADIKSLESRLTGFSPSSDSAPSGTEPSPVSAKPTQPDPGTPHDQLQTVRVRTEILDSLIDTTGELFTNRHRLLNIAGNLDVTGLQETLNELGRLLRVLHGTVMKVRLMPFASLAERFPRVVRDLSRRTGKEILFTVNGKEIELDRGVLEELADPLLHIIRNSVDHGIESPGDRVSSGKNPTGRVTLSLCREKDQAVIAVEDDGRGMDPELLIEAAVSKGLITAADGARFTPSEAYLLTCLPGFSTAQEVTDVSGRGVGMDAVRSTVQALGGSLTIESEAGRGSKFVLRLPLSIAIINVLLISTGRARVALPVTSVEKTLEVTREQILVRDRNPYIMFNDQELPLLSLNRTMGYPARGVSGGYHPVIVVVSRGRTIGVLVDSILGQREIHVKPIGRPLNRLRGLAGGGVLGDGEIVFVLDPATLF